MGTLGQRIPGLVPAQVPVEGKASARVVLLGGEVKPRLAWAGLGERTDWREVGATVALPGRGNCRQRQVSLGRSPRTAPARPGRLG